MAGGLRIVERHYTWPLRRSRAADDFAAMLNEQLGGEDEPFEGRVVKGIVTGIETISLSSMLVSRAKAAFRCAISQCRSEGRPQDWRRSRSVRRPRRERPRRSDASAAIAPRREAAWDTLEKEHEAGNRVDGSSSVALKAASPSTSAALSPSSGAQVDIRPVRDVAPLMDIAQPFQILKMDRRRGNIVVSRRAILEETRAEQRSGLIQSLAEGQVIEGVVKNITDYGAFVDLGGIDGLLHVTDISYKRVNHPSEVINIGDTVKVQTFASTARPSASASA